MKQLITSLFGPNAENEQQTAKMTTDATEGDSTDSTATPKHNGWKLTLKYRDHQYDYNPIQAFTISFDPTNDKSEADAFRDHCRKIIKTFQDELNAVVDDENMINFDNSLVIRKNQFVSLSLTTVK